MIPRCTVPACALLLALAPGLARAQNQRFVVELEATYTFNSYRLTYRYQLQDGERASAAVGLTAKIRAAEIALVQGATSCCREDRGFIPLLHLAGEWRLRPGWHLLADVDALAGGPGRAVAAKDPRLEPAQAPEPPPASVIRVSEGTALFFDVAPDGGSFVLDLLGQLWKLPADGGVALPLTDALRESADDRQPSFAPDGRSVATRSDRPEGRGIWVHGLDGARPVQLSDSASILGGDAGVPTWSPDGSRIAYVQNGRIRIVAPDGTPGAPLRIEGHEDAYFDEPSWSPDGRSLLVSGPWPNWFLSPRAALEGPIGMGIWNLDPRAGQAERITGEGVAARAPAWAPNGRSMAYFTGDSTRTFALVVRDEHGGERVITSERGIEPRRVRWSPDGRQLFYVAAGRLRRVGVDGGEPREVPFTAELRVPSPMRPIGALRLPDPGESLAARGFGGIALAPGGDRVALVALGRIWVAAMDGAVTSVADVHEAADWVAWSPDGEQLAWSDGGDDPGLWLLDLTARAPRRLTERRGAASWSPDGRWIAFTHSEAGETKLLVVAVADDPPGELLDLGPLPWDEISSYATAPQWLPGSDTLMVLGGGGWAVTDPECARAELVPLSGERVPVERFPCRPAHGVLEGDGALVAVEEGELVRRSRVAGGWGDVTWRSAEPALYPSASRNGSLLFAAADGLRIRAAEGSERRLGWPLRYRVPPAPPLILRNVHIVPLDGGGTAGLLDILLENGRIRSLAPAGHIGTVPTGTLELNGDGGWVMPGLIDLHTHLPGNGLAMPRAALYHGVTTVREMGTPLGRAAAVRDLQAAGEPAARVIVSGFPIYPAPYSPSLTSEVVWVTGSRQADEAAVALLRAFGAGHAKVRYVQTWATGAAFLTAARRAGLRAGGHCGHAVAFAAGGLNTIEHADGQCGEWEFGVRDDVIQLLRAAHVALVPVIDLHRNESRPDSLALHAFDVAPFTSGLTEWLLRPTFPADDAASARRERRALENVARMSAGGGVIGLGTDAEFFPGAVQRELQALLRAGLSPAAALRAATSDAAAILGLSHELGQVRVGYRADLLILEEDPTADLAAVQRIRAVLQDGRVVDRARLLERR
jgi:imidazolonepropionase-like amidohydrolase/Tol biopolymer transport system component